MAQINEIAVTFLEVFEDASALITELDILCSFAWASVSAPSSYTRPTLQDADHGRLIIRGGRHPLVEAQEEMEFVKNDCCMERQQSWFQFITGPNMGGKSTFIRQVCLPRMWGNVCLSIRFQIGLVVLMAQIGCFVPCDQAVIPLRDAIYARVGAGDCQQHGISTFMAEMLETSSIFQVH